MIIKRDFQTWALETVCSQGAFGPNFTESMVFSSFLFSSYGLKHLQYHEYGEQKAAFQDIVIFMEPCLQFPLHYYIHIQLISISIQPLSISFINFHLMKIELIYVLCHDNTTGRPDLKEERVSASPCLCSHVV